MNQASTTWADVVTKLISALVVLAALGLLLLVFLHALTFAPTDASNKTTAHSSSDVTAMVTGIGSLITSIVGLFFGISVARQGLDSAQKANTAAANATTALQTQQTENAALRGSLQTGLSTLKAQLPQQFHAQVETIMSKVNG